MKLFKIVEVVTRTHLVFAETAAAAKFRFEADLREDAEAGEEVDTAVVAVIALEDDDDEEVPA